MDIISLILLSLSCLFSLMLGILYIIKHRHNTSGIQPYSLLRGLNESIFITDNGYNIIYSNDSAAKLIKSNNAQIVNRHINNYIENYNPSQDNHANWETRCIASDKSLVPVNIKVNKIASASKNKNDFLFTVQNKSTKKQFLDQIRTKNQELEILNNKLDNVRQDLEKTKSIKDEEIKTRTQKIQDANADILRSIQNLELGLIITDSDRNIFFYNRASSVLMPSLDTTAKTLNQLQQIEQLNDSIVSGAENAARYKKIISIPNTLIGEQVSNIQIAPLLNPNPDAECLGAIITLKKMSDMDETDQSREDLFSIASHELRTPLTAIYGYVSLIKEIYFGQIQNKDLKNIINSIGTLSKRLSQNINNFLDASKLEQGRIEVKKEKCDLYAIIKSCIEDAENTAMGKNLYINFDPPETHITVIGDPARLMQIINIMLNNAIKFTNNGGIKISVDIQSDFADIKIQDSGSGIAEDIKPLLFSKFQQNQKNLLTRQEGTGLGLHIAGLLIEKMGGHIRLEESELNKGSTFAFTVPLSS